MVAANHFGRGILLNASSVTEAQTSEIFQDKRHGVRKTVVCVHSTVDCTTADSTGEPLVIEVEDPTTENTSTTFQPFTLTTLDITANTLEKVIIDAGAGSRIRCRIRPNSSADIKIWAWSSD